MRCPLSRWHFHHEGYLHGAVAARASDNGADAEPLMMAGAFIYARVVPRSYKRPSGHDEAIAGRR